jgi:hypothetical protein
MVGAPVILWRLRVLSFGGASDHRGGTNLSGLHVQPPLLYYVYGFGFLIKWTLELRPAWYTNNWGCDQNLVLTYDQSYDPHGFRKRQSEPRYACLWK